MFCLSKTMRHYSFNQPFPPRSMLRVSAPGQCSGSTLPSRVNAPVQHSGSTLPSRVNAPVQHSRSTLRFNTPLLPVRCSPPPVQLSGSTLPPPVQRPGLTVRFNAPPYLSPAAELCLQEAPQGEGEGTGHRGQPGQQPQPLGQLHPLLEGELHLHHHHGCSGGVGEGERGGGGGLGLWRKQNGLVTVIHTLEGKNIQKCNKV